MLRVCQERISYYWIRKAAAILLLAVATQSADALAAQTAPGSMAEVNAYFENDQAQIRESLKAYNAERAVVPTNKGARIIIHSHRVEAVDGPRAFVSISFTARAGYQRSRGNVLFEVEWKNGGYEFVGHRVLVESAKASKFRADPSDEGKPPLRSMAETKAYIEENETDLWYSLRKYNEANQVVKHLHWVDAWNVQVYGWEVRRVAGDRAYVAIEYGVGTTTRKTLANVLFEMRWVGDDLSFADHEVITNRAKVFSAQDSGDDECTFNYYSPRPCIEVMRKWREFVEIHDLPLDEESAAILQAYKQLEYDRGDRLMAAVKGIERPSESSVFALQDEVAAMNLSGASGDIECNWNPYGPKPCAEAVRLFREFAKRHDLEADEATANMFEAYADGNFRKADVIYALAKDLPVPAYGHVPSVAGRDVAADWHRTNRMKTDERTEKCEINPHGYKPCEGVVRMWRDFAARYELEDNPDNGRIFIQYVEGNYEIGDTHLAKAKGVSLETLMEASGVPVRGLTIEVYPGWRQKLRNLLFGT